MNGEPLVLEPRLYTRNTKDDELVRAAVLPLEQLLGASIVVDAQSQLRVQAERQKAQAAQQAADNAMDALRRQPDGYGALAMEAAQARGTCTIGAVPQGKSEAQADAARHGVLATQAYRQWRGSNDDRFSGVFGDASSLYTALQRQSCQVAVGSGAELAPMAAALRRDGVAFTVMPAVVSMDEAEAAYAQSKGFASAADLKLAAAMGGLSPARLARYRQAGIDSLAVYEEIDQRRRDVRYLPTHGPGRLQAKRGAVRFTDIRALTAVGYGSVPSRAGPRRKFGRLRQRPSRLAGRLHQAFGQPVEMCQRRRGQRHLFAPGIFGIDQCDPPLGPHGFQACMQRGRRADRFFSHNVAH